MTAAAWAAILVAIAIAAVDWSAVQRERKPLEYVCKPATMVALVVAAGVITPATDAQRVWVVIALVLCLAGDVFLMLPERSLGPADTFTFGLASFLLGHLAYIAGFLARGVDGIGALLGLAGVAIALAFLAPRIITAVRAREPALLAPVGAYMAVISVMVVTACGSGIALAAVGAALFYGSDSLIAWNRFIREQRNGRLAIIVTYHVAQVLLVASLTV